MKSDAYRIQQILTRDRMMDISSLPDLISNETAERLSNFLWIKSCVTKIKVANNGELDIVIAIKSGGTRKV